MFDDPRSDDTRDRDDWREREHAALERDRIDSRDVFTEGLNPPCGLGASTCATVVTSTKFPALRPADGTVHVIGKFKRERDIPMQPDAQAALAEQIEAEDRLWKQNPQRLREVLAEGALTRGHSEHHAARLAPHLRHARAPGRRRHLQAVEESSATRVSR